MTKIVVLYCDQDEGLWSPLRSDVGQIAIRLDSRIPYVWTTYAVGHTVPKDIVDEEQTLIIDIKQANKIFEFKHSAISALL